jgi:hypothetical protein
MQASGFKIRSTGLSSARPGLRARRQSRILGVATQPSPSPNAPRETPSNSSIARSTMNRNRLLRLDNFLERL